MCCSVRAYQAAHDEQLPLADRLAIRLAFSYLLQYSSAGRRPSEAAFSSAASAVTAAVVAADLSDPSSSSSSEEIAVSTVPVGGRFLQATSAATAAAVAVRQSAVATKGIELLKKIPLPIIRSTDIIDDEELAEQRRQQQQYVLTQAEERLIQVTID